MNLILVVDYIKVLLKHGSLSIVYDVESVLCYAMIKAFRKIQR